MDFAKRTFFKTLAGPMFLLVLATLLAYGNTFFAAFHYDDFGFILGNPGVMQGDVGYLWRVHASRFIAFLSFAVNYAVHGKAVFGYHIVNWLIHLAASMAVFFLAHLIANAASPDRWAFSQKNKFALFAALFFALHPIQTSAVTYIFQRVASLCALFYVWSLVFYFRSSQAWHQRQDQAACLRNFVWCFIFGFLAMLCKQNAFTLPFVIVLSEIYFFTTKKGFRGRNPFLLASSLLVLVIPYLSFVRHDFEMGLNFRADLNFLKPVDYFLTQLHVIPFYLKLVLLPTGLNLDHDFPVQTTLDGLTLGWFLFLLALVSTAFFLFRRFRILSYAVLLFFVLMAVESSFFPIIDVANEYRLYLPLVAIALFLAGILFLHVDLKPFWVVPFLLCLVLGILTFQRNRVYATEETLWQDVMAKSPRKVRAYNNLGVYYLKAHDEEKARALFLKTLTLRATDPMANFNLGLLAYDSGRFEEAREFYMQALAGNPIDGETHYNLAGVYLKLGNFPLAKRHFLAAKKLNFNVPQSVIQGMGLN